MDANTNTNVNTDYFACNWCGNYVLDLAGHRRNCRRAPAKRTSLLEEGRRPIDIYFDETDRIRRLQGGQN